MTIMVIDFQNMAHRSRCGYGSGDHAVVFNFFRSLRPLVERFKPTRVYVVGEGHPVNRKTLYPEYKARRVIDKNDPRREEMAKFHLQCDEIRDLLSKWFPVSFVRHPRHEADDTIANLIRRASTMAEWTVVSTDTDFIQLLGGSEHVDLFNPVKKVSMTGPDDHLYVVWKALRGDPTDDVPGIPGVGDRIAERLAKMYGTPAFDVWLDGDPAGRRAIFERNLPLIAFETWTDAEAMAMTSSSPVRDWDAVKTHFEGHQFKSITLSPNWEKFVGTFDYLFGR